jgi:hypothetical protein
MEKDERPYEDLTPAEKQLRRLIYAVEAKDRPNPNHPFPMGEAFLQHILEDCKRFAKRTKIPLTKVETYE